MARDIDKAALLAQLRERVAADLAAITESQRDAQAGATHEEARPESDKDTRATEGSYLARGLANRVAELREAVTLLESLALRTFTDGDAVSLSAVVCAEDEHGDEDWYFLAPAGAGIKLAGPGGLGLAVVTTQSPLGRALLGKRVDDEVELRTPGGARVLTITGVQ